MQWDNLIYVLSAIFGTSVGVSISIIMIIEGVGRMILLIPATIKKLKDQGREDEYIRILTWLEQQGYDPSNLPPRAEDSK